MKRFGPAFLLALLAVTALTVSACLLLTGSEAPEDIRKQDRGSTPSAEGVVPPAQDQASVDDVTIAQAHLYEDEFGARRILGLLTNRADYPVTAVSVTVEYLDVTGASIGQEISHATMAAIAPGETIPFSLRPTEDIPSMDGVEVTAAEVFKADDVIVQVDLLGDHFQVRENGIVQVSGEIANPTKEPVNLDRIAAAVFASSGEIRLAGECDQCVRHLAPGDKGPFRILMYGTAGVDASSKHRLYLTASRSVPLTAHEVTFTGEVYAYNDTLGHLHIVGEVQNSGEAALDLHLLGALYNADGDVIDAVTYDVMPASLGPGEVAPFDITHRCEDPESPIDLDSVSWNIQLDLARTRVVEQASPELATSGDFFENWAAFSGEVANDTGGSIQLVLVVAGLRDEDSGQLAAMGRQLLAAELSSGERAQYNIRINMGSSLDPETLDSFVIARGK